MTFATVAIGSGVGIAGGMGVQAYYGNKSASAARKANAAAAEEMRQSQARAVGYQRPYEAGGRAGFNVLTGLLTGNQYDQQGNVSNTLNPEERANLFQKSPGYQFRLEQAQNALQASQAARGGLLSGGAMKEMNAYTQGIASDEYGNYINQIQGLANMGQQAATNMGNYEVGAGSTIANYVQQGGMAAANNYANQGQIIGGGLQQIGSMGLGIAGRGAIGGGGGGGTVNMTAFNTAQGGQY